MHMVYSKEICLDMHPLFYMCNKNKLGTVLHRVGAGNNNELEIPSPNFNFTKTNNFAQATQRRHIPFFL